MAVGVIDMTAGFCEESSLMLKPQVARIHRLDVVFRCCVV